MLALLALTTICQFPPEILTAETYVCRVLTDRGTQYEGYGSGILVHGTIVSGKHQGNRYVLTSWHNIADYRKTVEVTWDGERWYSAIPACARKADDQALLVISQWPDEVCGQPTIGLKLAEYEVQEGETVYYMGFDGSSSTLVTRSGNCMHPVESKGGGGEQWFMFSGASTTGMSGGPIIVLREGAAHLIGTLWGTGEKETIGCRLSVIYAMWGRGEPPRSFNTTPKPDVPVATPALAPSSPLNPRMNIRKPGEAAMSPVRAPT